VLVDGSLSIFVPIRMCVIRRLYTYVYADGICQDAGRSASEHCGVPS
jgi:hypothetical protein